MQMQGLSGRGTWRSEPYFAAECLPPPTGGSWSTRDEPGNNARLLAVMKERDIKRAFVPHAVFNGRVGMPKGEWVVRHINRKHELLMSPDTEPFEGYEIAKGDALVCPAGGCMFVVATGEAPGKDLRMIFSHAGRDSLIDRHRILLSGINAYTEKPIKSTSKRPFEGVLHSIVDTFRGWGIVPQRMEVHGLFSIAPSVFIHPYNHPTYGEFNRLLLRDLQRPLGGTMAAWETGTGIAIDQCALLREQAEEVGIPHVKCYPYLPVDEEYAHTRHPDLAMRVRRNLVILHRLR